jgi:GGDEF domain-containing protein
MLGGLSSERPVAAEQAARVAEKIRASLAEPYLLEPPLGALVEHHCTASIGVVLFLSGTIGQEELLEHGDAAMYQAKQRGRNQVCVWSAEEQRGAPALGRTG